MQIPIDLRATLHAYEKALAKRKSGQVTDTGTQVETPTATTK